MAKEWDPNNIFDVFADERARAILIATKSQNRSVKDLDEVLDASQSAIYRRVDVLVGYGLLEEQTHVDEDGHHYSVYAPDFDEINVKLSDEAVTVTIYPDEVELEMEH